MRIGIIIIFHLSKVWEASSLYCVTWYFWWGYWGDLKWITFRSERVKTLFTNVQYQGAYAYLLERAFPFSWSFRHFQRLDFVTLFYSVAFFFSLYQTGDHWNIFEKAFFPSRILTLVDLPHGRPVITVTSLSLPHFSSHRADPNPQSCSYLKIQHTAR